MALVAGSTNTPGLQRSAPSSAWEVRSALASEGPSQIVKQPDPLSDATVVDTTVFGTVTITPPTVIDGPVVTVTGNVAWTYETGNIAGENTVSCPLPSTVTTGDWILFYAGIQSTLNTIAGTPSGWTQIMAPTATVSGNTSGKVALYAKKYASGDETGSVSIAPSGADSTSRWVLGTFRIQDADQTTLIEAGPSVQDGFSGNTITAPSVTSTTSLSGMVFFFARGATNVFATDGSWTVPTGTTKLVEVNSHTTSSNPNFMAASLSVQAGVASGTKSSTVTMSGAGGTAVSAGQGISLILKSGVAASGDATITPGVVAGAVTIASPTTSAGSGATITGAVVTGAVTVSSPTMVAGSGATVSGAVVAGSVAVAAPTITSGSSVTVAPANVSGAVTIPSPVKIAGATVVPSVVSGAVAIPAATILSLTGVAPATVNGAASVPSPTLIAGAGATVTPVVISRLVSIPAPALVAGGSSTVTPAVVAGAVTIPAATVSASSPATVVATTASGTVAIPSPFTVGGSGGGLITHVQTVTATNRRTSVSAWTPAMPTHQAGDLLIAFHGIGSSADTVIYPSDWKELDRAVTTGVGDSIVYKIATSSAEQFTAQTTTGGGVNREHALTISCYRGVHQSTPIQSYTKALQSSASLTHVTSALTGVLNSFFELSFASDHPAAAAATNTGWTPPSGVTLRGEAINTDTQNQQADVVVGDTLALRSDGSVPARTWTSTVSANGSAWSLALIPSGAVTFAVPTVNGGVSIGSPTVSAPAGSTVTPSTIAGSVAVAGPVVTGGAAATVTPATISRSVVIPAPSVSQGGVPAVVEVTGNVAWTHETGNIAGENGITVPLPSTAVLGDWILFVVICVSTNNTIAATPTGWSVIMAPTATIATSTSSKVAIYAKPYATGDNTGTVFIDTTVQDSTTRWAAATLRVSGADATTLMEVSPTKTDGATGATITAPSITTTTSQYGLNIFYGRTGTNTFVTEDSWTIPSNSTPVVQVNSHTTSSNPNFLITSVPLIAGVASGTRSSTATITGGATTFAGAMGVSMAFKVGVTSPNATINPSTVSGTGSVASPAVSDGSVTQTVTWAWVGDIDANTALVSAKLSGGTNARLKVATDTGLTTGVIYGTTTSIGVNKYVKLPVSGLSANTRYYYAIEVDGSLITGHDGEFTTAQVGAHSFRITFASCNNSNVTSTSWANMLTKNPVFFVHTGDYHYQNITTNTPTSIRAGLDLQMAKADSQELFMRKVPTQYIWSDHDFGGNNSVGTAASKPAVQSVYRECVPNGNLPADQGNWNGTLAWNGEVCHTWVRGRVRFVFTDERSNKTVQTATDNSSKTMLGATQKQWFKDTLTNCSEQLIIWAGDTPWTGAVIAGDDHWASYDTERQELATFITGLTGKKVIRISGDQHCLAYNDGTLNSPGGLICFSAAPLNQTASSKGSWNVSYSSSTQNYGQIDFTDTGGTSIGVDFTGYDSANVQRIAMSTSATVSAAGSTITPATVSGSATIAGTPSAPVTVSATTVSRTVFIPAPTVSATTGSTAATPSTVTGSLTSGYGEGGYGQGGYGQGGIAIPTVIAGVNATVTPATVSRAVVIAGGTAAATSGSTVPAVTVSRLIVIPAPTVQAGVSTGPSASTVSRTIVIPAPVMRADRAAVVIPTRVLAVASVGSPGMVDSNKLFNGWGIPI